MKIVCVLLSLSLSFSLLSGCKERKQMPLPPTEVVIQAVVPQDVPVEFEFTGQLAGSREVEIRPRVTGILLKRYFKEGSRVKEGDLLYQIDPADFKTALDQMEALRQKQQSSLAQAERNYNRLKPLLADHAVSHKDVDDAKTEVEQARSALATADAQVAQARLNLGYTRITAPISGIISLSEQSEGTLVNGPQTLMTKLVQIDPVYVFFSFSENEKLHYDRLRQAGKLILPQGVKHPDVLLKLADGMDYPIKGEMNFSDTLFSSKTGTLQLRAEFANLEHKLLPGQFAKVTLKGFIVPKAILIPQKAVLTTAQGKAVMVVNKTGIVEIRPIEVGMTQGIYIFVNSGLSPGDQLVIDGNAKAEPGKPVKAVQFTASTSTSI